jgi:hypothetical protein
MLDWSSIKADGRKPLRDGHSQSIRDRLPATVRAPGADWLPRWIHPQK